MQQQVFKTNIFISLVIPILIGIALVVVYVTNESMPSWMLLFLLVPIIFIVASMRTKLVIENGMLRYEKVFSADEVPLSNVYKIMTREVETIVDNSPRNNSIHQNNMKPGLSINSNQINQVNQERKVERIVYVMDESHKVHLSFPANLIGMKNRNRFIESVNAANSNIEIS